MLEFTTAYLKTFPWAKAAYDYTLGLSTDTDINLDISNLSAPSLPSVSEEPISIFRDVDWNIHSLDNISLIGAMYSTIDQGESYLESFYSLVNSRLGESEKRIYALEANLRAIRTIQKVSASTSINISGGDPTWVDNNPKFYDSIGPLERVVDEGIFRLKDTGHFSSIRSLGGFAGETVIEESLGQIVHNGSLAAIVDGTRDSFWMGTFYAPAPLKADSNDIPWLPEEYKHGFAFMLTYFLDRPSMASEVYIDPVTTEPFDLVSISWTPVGLTNTISCSTFESTGCWTYNYNSGRAAGVGIDNSFGTIAYAPSGWASYTFAVTGTLVGHRAQLVYNMMGRGDCRAGARLVWLDSSNNVIDYQLKEEFPSGFFVGYRMVDIIPPLAVSGRIDLGIFTPTTQASAMFDNISLLLGEQTWHPNIKIDKPTTVPLPRAVLSGRYSFVFAQRNLRREVLSLDATTLSTVPHMNSTEIDTNLQKSISLLGEDLENRGTENTVFAYRIGLKELDLRYREYVPRGLLVSLPIKTQREIRRMWVTTELGKHHTAGSVFYIYPFEDDAQNRISVLPYRVGDTDAEEIFQTSEGDVLNIFTQEEVDKNWQGDSTYIVINPKRTIETFDGSTREGKINTKTAIHLRTTLVQDISNWLENNAIWPTSFDPNAETLYGISDSTIKNSIREGDLPTVGIDDLESRPGYIPVKVTVKTDRWVAYPDTFGRPDKSRVREVTGEILTPATTTESVTDTSSEVQGYESWLNSTTINDLFVNLTGKQPTRLTPASFSSVGLGGLRFLDSDKNKTLKQILDSLSSGSDDSNNVYKKSHNKTAHRLEGRFRHIYDKLKGQGKIQEIAPSLGVITTSVDNGDTFSTRFKPLVTGPSGSFIRLWWLDELNSLYLPISQKDYKIVNPNLGVVKILTSAPGSGYTDIVADYKYISYSTTEDHFSSVLGYVSVGASGVSAISGGFRSNTRTYPITRNMTDYITGNVPVLTPPNMDRTSRDYYPIIEYYVNSNGEIVLAREFFKYGDQPATIIVESDTLGIAPRLGVGLTRGGSPSTSASILSASLRAKERSSSPTRGTD